MGGLTVLRSFRIPLVCTLFFTSSSSKKTFVGLIDDGINFQFGDVAAEDRHFVRQIVAVAGEIFSRFLWNLKNKPIFIF